MARKIALSIAAVLGALILVLLAWEVSQILLMLFAGALLAILLRGSARWLNDHTPLHGRWSLLVIIGATIIIAVLGSFLAAPHIAERIDLLIERFPPIVAQAQGEIAQYGWGQNLLERANSFEVSASQAAGVGGTIVRSLSWFFVGLILILATGIYLAIDPEPYVGGVIALTPRRHRRRTRRIMDTLQRKLERWLIGRLASMAVIGVLTSIGLFLIGAPLPLTLGVIAGLLSFIPNIGPVLSGFLAAIVAFSESWQLAAWVVGLFLLVQLVESYLITPMIEKRAVNLPPAFVIAVQIVMGLVFGFMGLLVATPLAVVVVELVKHLYVEKSV